MSSLLPGDLFTEKTLVVPCTLGNRGQIQTRFLLDTGATSIAFIDKDMTRNVCHVLEISFISLAKSKPLKRFDGRSAQPVAM